MLRLSLFALALCGCLDTASSTTQASTTGRDHRPPQEAIDACASSTADAACAFDIDTHHVTGTCKHGPDGGGPLACAPDHPPPPPEAFAACASSATGDACAFDIDGHHVTGACRQGPDAAAPLACAPDHPPPL
jgi:hypothetical protein